MRWICTLYVEFSGAIYRLLEAEFLTLPSQLSTDMHERKRGLQKTFCVLFFSSKKCNSGLALWKVWSVCFTDLSKIKRLKLRTSYCM